MKLKLVKINGSPGSSQVPPNEFLEADSRSYPFLAEVSNFHYSLSTLEWSRVSLCARVIKISFSSEKCKSIENRRLFGGTA